MIKVETYSNIEVLRDDLLPGGTKSVLLDKLLDKRKKEYVYASPVYGGFQIALSLAVKERATIFCAERSKLFVNTLSCITAGAKIMEVSPGYLNVVQDRAKKYVEENLSRRQLIEFGAISDVSRLVLTDRVKAVVKKIGGEPDEIWCAIGSGLLFESILAATRVCKVIGVVVGRSYVNNNDRGRAIQYSRSFDKPSKTIPPFPSMRHYDAKAWHLCLESNLPNNRTRKQKKILFWNVL